jgi:hypothetical protein
MIDPNSKNNFVSFNMKAVRHNRVLNAAIKFLKTVSSNGHNFTPEILREAITQILSDKQE